MKEENVISALRCIGLNPTLEQVEMALLEQDKKCKVTCKHVF